MKSITQDIKYYQAILSYADQHGVTKAAIKYRTYRQFIYRLRNRYDGGKDLCDILRIVVEGCKFATRI